MSLGSTDAAAVTAAETGSLPWPVELAAQMQSVQAVVQQTAAPLTAAQVAARFRRTRPERVRPLLNTLAALFLVRATPEGAYGA